MSNLYKILLFTLLLSNGFVKAQDMHFTQFYASPLYLNPAFTGAGGCTRAFMTYRNQWPGINKAYKSYMVAGDHFLPEQNIGLGLVIAQDLAGTGNLKTTIINPLIAYQTQLGKTVGMRVGFQPGIGMRSINLNNLTFGDQIARGGQPTTETIPNTKTFFDFGTGALFYTSKYWGGLSIYHLTRPDESLIEGDSKLPVKYSLHGGYKYVMNEDEKDEFEKQTLTTAFHYRGQKEFDQFDIGLYYTKYIMNFGVWYRGLPIKHYKPGYRNDDALAFIIGITNDRMNIGYSYDVTISKLARVSNGAHELNFSYTVCMKVKRKKKMIIPCPKF